jgi:hypothetical protein
MYLSYDYGRIVEQRQCCKALAHELNINLSERNVFNFGEKIKGYDGFICSPNR